MPLKTWRKSVLKYPLGSSQLSSTISSCFKETILWGSMVVLWYLFTGITNRIITITIYAFVVLCVLCVTPIICLIDALSLITTFLKRQLTRDGNEKSEP